MSSVIAMEFIGNAVMPAKDKILPLTSTDKPAKPKKKKKKKRATSKRANSTDQRERVQSITGSSSTQNSASTNSWSSSEARSTGASSAENLAVTTSSSSFSVLDCLTSQELPPTRSRQKESLRWCTECENSDDEAERIRVYKQNRRKRYTNFLYERAGADAVICQKKLDESSVT